MKNIKKYKNENQLLFNHILDLSSNYKSCFYLNSLNYKNDNYTAFDWIIAIDEYYSLVIDKNTENALFKIDEFLKNHTNEWKFSYLSYDFKNHIEKLETNHNDKLNFHDCYFVEPKFIITSKENIIEIQSNSNISDDETSHFLKIIEETKIKKTRKNVENILFKNKINKTTYINQIEKLKHEIKTGNIYEVNFCQEFYAENININPSKIFEKLNDLSPAPFSAFVKENERFLISASPERFIAKRNNKIISQPIKGTAKKYNEPKKDAETIHELENSEKERAENIMIVDLVRNDLSNINDATNINVEELCKIYSFKHVHQMISTISAEIKPETSFSEIIKKTFPMGSMTGAPKISAMNIIENHENLKRGLFSGSVGYIQPNGDFDFNVIIRSLQYNNETKYLSLITGSAITFKSNAEDEYEESLLKANSILTIFD